LNYKGFKGNAMYAIEFDTDITGKYIELQNYEQLLNKHAKVIILVNEMHKQSEEPVTQTVKQLQRKYSPPPLEKGD
jgi:hypothetical protein